MKPSDLNPATQRAMGLTPKKRHKYNVSAKADRTCDGITFDSKKEMQRYQALKLARANGLLKYFLRQIPLHLPGNVRYVCDFMVVYNDDSISFQDVKGFKTAMYRLKKKQVEALYPITIDEV